MQIHHNAIYTKICSKQVNDNFHKKEFKNPYFDKLFNFIFNMQEYLIKLVFIIL